MKSKTQRAAVTGGLLWAILLFLTTLAGVYFNYATNFLNVIVSIYPGYSISLTGSIVGLVYGFLDVFIGVYIFSWVYHRIGNR